MQKVLSELNDVIYVLPSQNLITYLEIVLDLSTLNKREICMRILLLIRLLFIKYVFDPFT